MPKDHLISRFYLKGFADHNGKVFLKDPAKAREISLRSASVVESYYSSEDQNIQLESLISLYESNAAPVIRKILETHNYSLTQQEDARLFNYMAITYLKSARARRLIQDVGMVFKQTDFVEVYDQSKQTYKMVRREALNQSDLVVSDLKSVEVHDENNDELKRIQLKSMKRSLKEISWQRNAFQLQFVYFERKKLLTSDSPVILFSSSGEAVGLSNCSEIYLPLSSSIAVIYSRINASRKLSEITASTKLQELLNNSVLITARRFIVCNPLDRNLLEGFEFDAQRPELDIDSLIKQLS